MVHVHTKPEYQMMTPDILNPVNSPSPNPSGRGYPRPIGHIQRYHAVVGANGTTMVMVVMFVG